MLQKISNIGVIFTKHLRKFFYTFSLELIGNFAFIFQLCFILCMHTHLQTRVIKRKDIIINIKKFSTKQFNFEQNKILEGKPIRDNTKFWPKILYGYDPCCLYARHLLGTFKRGTRSCGLSEVNKISLSTAVVGQLLVVQPLLSRHKYLLNYSGIRNTSAIKKQ